MTGAAVLGPWPGTDPLEAQSVAFGELGDPPDGVRGLPPLVAQPARGPGADAVGTAASLLTQLPVELGPHGWRLADRPGRDLERARTLRREELDALAVAGHGYAGPLVVAVCGPLSLAATLYLARGDRVVGDAGALRELAASLADGVAELLGRVATAVPGAGPIVVLREPDLAAVLGGGVASFSGHGRLRSVEHERAAALLREVVDAARRAGATEVVAHPVRGPVDAVLATLLGCGADAVGLPAGPLGAALWERVAGAVEAGTRTWFALPAEPDRPGGPDVAALTHALAGPWRAVGLPAAGLADVVVHAEGGAPGAPQDLPGVRRGLGTARRVAVELAERAAAG